MPQGWQNPTHTKLWTDEWNHAESKTDPQREHQNVCHWAEPAQISLLPVKDNDHQKIQGKKNVVEHGALSQLNHKALQSTSGVVALRLMESSASRCHYGNKRVCYRANNIINGDS